MRRTLVIAGCLAGGLTTAAEARSGALDDPALKTAISGKTVNISTPIGLPLTVNYGANGIMVGTVGTALAAYLGSSKDRGRWRVHNGRLCQKWFKWLASEEICMQIRPDGDTIHWRTDAGRTGTATIEAGPPVLAGASASGLGAPLPVSQPAPSPSVTAPPPETAPLAVPAPREPQQATAWRTTPTPEPRAEADLPPPPHRTPAAPAAPLQAEPSLVEPMRQVVLAAAPGPSPVGRPATLTYAVASLSPLALVRPPAAATRPPAEPSPPAEPAEADRSLDLPPMPMRAATDLATYWSLEHRWCHANALATSATYTMPQAGLDSAFSDVADTPSLLSIAKDQTAPGELPLQQPACLTSEPALHMISKQELR